MEIFNEAEIVSNTIYCSERSEGYKAAVAHVTRDLWVLLFYCLVCHAGPGDSDAIIGACANAFLAPVYDPDRVDSNLHDFATICVQRSHD